MSACCRVPAARLIHLGLDQNGPVASHRHHGQDADDRHDDEQDGEASAHETRPGHPHVTPLAHVPEVLTHEASGPEHREARGQCVTPRREGPRRHTGTREAALDGGYRCRGGGSSPSGSGRSSCSLLCRDATHTRTQVGTAVASHTLPPADLRRRRSNKLYVRKPQTLSRFLITGL